MEDHHPDDHYGSTMADLRHLITANPPPHFPPSNLFAAAGHRNLPFDIMVGGRQNLMPPPLPLHDFVTTDHSRNTSSTTSGAGVGTVAGAGTTTACGSAAISGSTSFFGGFEGDVGGTGRWPRQETLTLLDIRSRLDPKFKEANHKGPLWDEVSSIMSEEHGYQRSGKKCREKFENLYKYYKKTKDGKAGRQDGKHYRFFRQLEALYGETTTNNNPPVVSTTSMSFPNQPDHVFDSLSLSNSPGLDTCSSSEDDNDGRRRRRRRSWKSKVKDFIDTQMRKLMEKQEAWLEKMMRAMEQKEQERVVREEQWRTEEAARMERERNQWAKERAWIESRDAALMEFLDKVNGKGSSPEAENDDNTKGSDNHWAEPEITRLIQLKSSLESRLSHSHDKDGVLWDEIGAKMACYGYERSATMCKEKWDTINYYLVKKTKEEYNKKRKEDYNFNTHTNDGTNYSLYNQGRGRAYCEIINERGPDQTARIQPHNNDGSSPSSSNAGNVLQDSCFRFLMGDGHHHGLWESYGLKLNNGENQ